MGNENTANTKPSDVATKRMTEHDLASFERAREALGTFKAPAFAGEDSPNKRVFIASFDGTGNDKNSTHRDRHENLTNVALMGNRVEQLMRDGHPQIAGGYVAGVGTQEDNKLIEGLDGAKGYTYSPRMERMYYDFCVQAEKWKRDNPNAEISVMSTGFSRGAVTAAMFTRMVEERGIQHPENLKAQWDEKEEFITKLKITDEYPPLVPPGKTAQAVGLFDPVATGSMQREDVRLPPSVISGFQINAADENRDLFALKQIIDPGVSDNGRFLSVTVAGAHSDIGGSYHLNGASIRTGNMMNDYFNAALGQDVFQQRPVPQDPAMNVIHDSTGHQSFYTQLHKMLTNERRSVDQLTPNSLIPGKDALMCDVIQKVNCYDSEPVNQQLKDQLQQRDVRLSAETYDHRSMQTILNERLPNKFSPDEVKLDIETTDLPALPEAKSQTDISRWFDQMTAAAARGDKQGVDAATLAYTNSPDGQAWLQAGRDANQQQEQQQAQVQQQQQEQQAEVQRAPAMRMH